MNILTVVAVILCNISLLSCEDQNPYVEAIKPWKSIQEYVEIRPGAFIFYWLYYADGTSIEAESKPLIIWIQGGPGLPASGIANFNEIGPLTIEMKPRNHTWVKGRNVLLIDHPVGTGFSYAKNRTLYVKSDREAVRDLVSAIRAFFKKHKNFRQTPAYLIGQSYGSKLSPRVALLLHTYIQRGRVKMNLKGVGLGSAWVDPRQSSLAQPDFLYHMGILDKKAYTEILNITHEICDLMGKKMYDRITPLKIRSIYMIYGEAQRNINFNNINQPNAEPMLNRLAVKVNKYVKPTISAVNQSLQWTFLSDDVFDDLTPNFYQGTTKYVEALLNHTSLKLAIYNGNLDVVTPLAGATNWVHALKWEQAGEFLLKKRSPIQSYVNGYYKSVGPLSFWAVFGAGHWVPEDNPVAMEQILEHLLTSNEND